MRILRDSFPVLVADPPAAVEGLVFTAAGAQDDARILFFEDYDYDLAPCRPVLDDGTTVEATFCGAAEGVAASDEPWDRSEEHTSELQSLMRISYAASCLK